MSQERSDADPSPPPGDDGERPQFLGSASPEGPEFVEGSAAGPPRFVGYPSEPEDGSPAERPGGALLRRLRRRLGRNAQ